MGSRKDGFDVVGAAFVNQAIGQRPAESIFGQKLVLAKLVVLRNRLQDSVTITQVS